MVQNDISVLLVAGRESHNLGIVSQLLETFPHEWADVESKFSDFSIFHLNVKLDVGAFARVDPVAEN